MIDYTKQLRALRDKLGNGNMSLMVGSGFSKNVSTAFPNWRELLYDLASDLYKDEIEATIPASTSEEEINRILDIAIQRKIDQHGYLNIVSTYIRKKGFGESIVTYIEERTPIIKENGKYYLIEHGQKIPLTKEHLSLHSMLMRLPWNNVYTTNYDPLLECCVNTDAFESLLSDNRRLVDEIAELGNKIHQAEMDMENLHEEINDRSEDTRLNNPDVPDIQKIVFENNHDLLDKLSECRNEIESFKKRRKSSEEQISRNEKAMMSSYTLVKEASALRLKRNKNIIKLHGSLRSAEERALNHFGFDRDPHKQYIISSEHYETYPKKHEAFTQLMRISLLQESFCLIGFSGVDPNFLSWIEWVRDLLYMHVSRNRGNLADYKIYFIDLDKNVSKPDRLLFYENNSIVRIPLLSDEVTGYLSLQTGLTYDTSDTFRSALSMLIHYLSEDERIAASSIKPMEESLEKDWQSVWDGLFTYGKKQKISAEQAKKSLSILNSLRPHLGLPYFQGLYLRNQLNFLWSFEKYLQGAENEEQRRNLLTMALQAIERYFVPPRTILSESAIIELLNHSETSEKTKMLIYRNDTLSDPLQAGSDNTFNNSYEDILRTAYSFRYDLLKEKLLSWNPTIHQLHLKAGFLAWFDIKQAEELVQLQLRSDALTEQERLYSLELLRNISISIAWEKAEKINRKIAQYKSAGYPLLIENFKYLQGKLEPQTAKPTPRGKGRFSISGVSGADAGEVVYAYQYMYLLMESGFQVRLLNSVLQESSKWYYVFAKGVKNYPFPYIYYTLQYTDENFILRTAQDVAFEKELPHAQIASALFDAYWTIPEHQQDSLLLFLSELIQVVSPSIWQNQFLKIWNGLVESEILFSELETAIEKFVRSSLRFIEKESIAFDVVADMLINRTRNTKQIISYLYYLSNNLIFKKTTPESVPQQLSGLLDLIITELPLQPADNIFMLGNLHYLLTDGQQSLILKQLEVVDFSTIRHANTWRIVLHFIPDNNSIRDKIKAAITNHSTLWFTGINGKSISRSGESMISIDAITKSRRHPKGLTWNQAEITMLFTKMKAAAADIERVSQKEIGFFDFVSELEEMYMFLLKNKHVLSAVQDYDAVFMQVSNLFFHKRGYTNLADGLTSADQGSVLYALGEFSIAVEEEVADPKFMSLLLNKILLQSPPAIEASLEYLAFWIEDNKNVNFFTPFISVIIQILNRYQQQPLRECDIVFVESMLVKIAFGLSKFKLEASAVEEWIVKARQSRFNASRQRAEWHSTQLVNPND